MGVQNTVTETCSKCSGSSKWLAGGKAISRRRVQASKTPGSRDAQSTYDSYSYKEARITNLSQTKKQNDVQEKNRYRYRYRIKTGSMVSIAIMSKKTRCGRHCAGLLWNAIFQSVQP